MPGCKIRPFEILTTDLILSIQRYTEGTSHNKNSAGCRRRFGYKKTNSIFFIKKVKNIEPICLNFYFFPMNGLKISNFHENLGEKEATPSHFPLQMQQMFDIFSDLRPKCRIFMKRGRYYSLFSFEK